MLSPRLYMQIQPEFKPCLLVPFSILIVLLPICALNESTDNTLITKKKYQYAMCICILLSIMNFCNTLLYYSYLPCILMADGIVFVLIMMDCTFQDVYKTRR